jgi:hypothetical protein
MGDAFGGIGGALSGVFGQQAYGQLAASAFATNTYQLGTYTTTGTITIGGSDFGGYKIVNSPSAPPAVQKQPNEAWLDQRIEEMRVRL